MILLGDCREVLATLPAESVQCCVTSPPYWGLRDYGVAGQLGLEPTPEAYVENMVAVFREVRRVLRADGTLWLNLGDSYATGAGATNTTDPKAAGRLREASGITQPNRRPIAGLKPKDLVGIPWRVAFALQADGWWLRSAIVWHKPNPMPESVRDRPTSAYEFVFLLAKSEKYFYDADAIAEPAGYAHEAKWDNGQNGHGGGESHKGQGSSTRKFRSGNKERKYGEAADRPGSHLGRGVPWEGINRNARNVWTIATKPFADAHFAVFPLELAQRCILAGSRPGDTILDPFAGAGTAGLAAQEHNREYIGIELNPAYIEIAERRLAQNVLPLLETA